MNIVDGKKFSNGLKEVIYAALDGKIYFLDLADGLETRPPIATGFPFKGTASIDPRGYPLLYAGQGIDEINGKPVGIGYRIFNLLDQKQIYYIEGIDKYTLRYWGAFDSCPLIDKNTDTLLLCGENSLFYKIKLNTKFDINAVKISINPEMTRYRYYSLKNLRLGIENSPAAFKDRIYFQDNEGVLQCVDINNLSPVWVRDVTDDSDSSVALDLESSGALSLYTACETDHQGNGYSYIRKINAADGSLIWEVKYECRYDGATNGGVLSSPLIGKNSISNLVIYSISKTVLCEGLLIAFDKDSGKEIWRKESPHYSWSSPVDIYTDAGTGYIIFCDSGGNMYLLDGKTGRTIDKISLGGAVEGSPAVYGNMVVIGTRGMKILGVRVY